MSGQGRVSVFVVARNPQDDSKLPFLLRLPLEGGLMLKARDRWPTTARVYCHRFEDTWPENIEIVEQTPALLCRRRGAAIDLLLDRPRLARSQFVFTQVKGREAIFWQTQKTARAANPGGIPRRRQHSPTRPNQARTATETDPSTPRIGIFDPYTLFPNGVPPRESVVRDLNAWLDEAERLARRS